VARGYGGRNRRLPDAGELIGIILLVIMAVWGVWFAWQSWLGLWWPLNVAYMAAGLVVALISLAVARALLNR
jgi:hypothetical protein